MHRVSIRTAEVLARTRAHLAALMGRLRSPSLRRIDPEEAAAFEEAAREAFRAGTTLESPRPLAPAPTAESPKAAPDVARWVASVSAPIASAVASAVEPAREPAVAERPGRKSRRQAGETAPDSLLRTPTSVTRVADDFFDGLIRRVESDR